MFETTDQRMALTFCSCGQHGNVERPEVEVIQEDICNLQGNINQLSVAGIIIATTAHFF